MLTIQLDSSTLLLAVEKRKKKFEKLKCKNCRKVAAGIGPYGMGKSVGACGVGCGAAACRQQTFTFGTFDKAHSKPGGQSLYKFIGLQREGLPVNCFH